jgi:hypothetical protein
MSALEALVASMTISELARLAGTSVEKVVAAAFDTGARLRPAPRTAATTRTPKKTTRRASVPRGGLRLDHVLSALATFGEPAKLDYVRAKVGGSVPQVRSALQKLAKSGKVRITVERRGTRYHAR